MGEGILQEHCIQSTGDRKTGSVGSWGAAGGLLELTQPLDKAILETMGTMERRERTPGRELLFEKSTGSKVTLGTTITGLRVGPGDFGPQDSNDNK